MDRKDWTGIAERRRDAGRLNRHAAAVAADRKRFDGTDVFDDAREHDFARSAPLFCADLRYVSKPESLVEKGPGKLGGVGIACFFIDLVRAYSIAF